MLPTRWLAVGTAATAVIVALVIALAGSGEAGGASPATASTPVLQAAALTTPSAIATSNGASIDPTPTASSQVSPPTTIVEPAQTPGANTTSVPTQTPGVQPSANPTVTPTTPTESPDAGSLVRLRIPALDVDAVVSPLGFDSAGGFAVPTTAASVGWYDFSARPGAPGNAVLGGHLDWRGSSGVFGRLNELSPGDMIYLDTGDGELAFRIVGSFSVTAQTPFIDILGERSGPSTLTLFTCGGTFSSVAGEYDERLVVNAVRV